MTDAIVQFFVAWPSWLATIALSMIPLTEMQLAIPLAIHSWSLAPATAMGLALIGNVLVFLPLYLGLERLRAFFATHVPALTRPIDAMLVRGQGKLQEQYARYGALALLLFTAIPFPLSGVWTATFAAVALKIPFKHAFFGILLGQVSAGIIIVVAALAGGAALG